MRKTKHPLYTTWVNMMARCYKPYMANYKYYGGKGITVCQEWHTFDNFIKDMGDKPGPEYSLDRINGNEGYSKENCRWATHKTQCSKRSSKNLITHNGDTLPLKTMGDKLGINHNTLLARINMGWNVDEALNTPVKNREYTSNKGEYYISASGTYNGFSFTDKKSDGCSTIEACLMQVKDIILKWDHKSHCIFEIKSITENKTVVSITI